MSLTAAGAGVLEVCERDVPVALPGEVLVRVLACGVCGIDLHILDGDLPSSEIPIVPGHEIVGVIDVVGDGVAHFTIGDRVGIPWLGHTCGTCEYCASGRENLCRSARFIGCDADGGFAEYAVADAAYTFKLPDGYSDAEAAPLLCAGITGYRAYRMARRSGSGCTAADRPPTWWRNWRRTTSARSTPRRRRRRRRSRSTPRSCSRPMGSSSPRRCPTSALAER